MAAYEKRGRIIDRLMPWLFVLMALIPILTTIGIVATLIVDAARFFQVVSLREVFSTNLAPLRAEPSFGFLPLINGTLMTTLIAMLVAIPLGL